VGFTSKDIVFQVIGLYEVLYQGVTVF